MKNKEIKVIDSTSYKNTIENIKQNIILIQEIIIVVVLEHGELKIEDVNILNN